MKIRLPTIPAISVVEGVTIALLVFCLVITAWWALSTFRRGQDAPAITRAGNIQSAANTASASEAAKITDRAVNSAAASEQLSRETADVIRQAPGADQALDPRLNDAGLRRLCLRAAYARSEQCVQLARRANAAG